MEHIKQETPTKTQFYCRNSIFWTTRSNIKWYSTNWHWHHLHYSQSWPPDGVSCIGCKFAHQASHLQRRLIKSAKGQWKTDNARAVPFFMLLSIFCRELNFFNSIVLCFRQLVSCTAAKTAWYYVPGKSTLFGDLLWCKFYQ